ncbi:transposase [Streptococcus pyogenes MGAS5005]|nr:transposase [Streptococcus pyogenes MGAS5005]
MNHSIKKSSDKARRRVVFPNEEALERCLVSIFEDYNIKFGARIHKGFGACFDTLDSLFD